MLSTVCIVLCEIVNKHYKAYSVDCSLCSVPNVKGSLYGPCLIIDSPLRSGDNKLDFLDRIFFRMETKGQIRHCTVYCVLYTVHCSVFNLRVKLYTVHGSVYTLRVTVYSVHCTLFSVYFTRYSVHCALCSLNYALYTAHRTQHTAYCTMYTVH